MKIQLSAIHPVAWISEIVQKFEDNTREGHFCGSMWAVDWFSLCKTNPNSAKCMMIALILYSSVETFWLHQESLICKMQNYHPPRDIWWCLVVLWKQYWLYVIKLHPDLPHKKKFKTHEAWPWGILQQKYPTIWYNVKIWKMIVRYWD